MRLEMTLTMMFAELLYNRNIWKLRSKCNKLNLIAKIIVYFTCATLVRYNI